MKNKMKVLGLSLGVMGMLFASLIVNPSNAKASKEAPHHICCMANSSGCTDLGGVFWEYDEARVAETCTR
ncbi:hypothetical protein PBT90_16965 [Algoriphagus halophytocola]|uniref:Uncharacterized protein n=1 Tax=Algoriphagus halophytocola TaxID=2991499 RepID=A0ABY6MFK3_9BACT|nr:MULTISPECIES: hypothetical protein [unclassified Algoriphagus]UZD21217.1 hypothetical protein OM944_11100 [Algoriphagus sp. TR-M5]WBL42428.1 hypothetical protein PBT90_16965 [Algoriphagus sp. TR-M9]